jgi:hypothetical protein
MLPEEIPVLLIVCLIVLPMRLIDNRNVRSSGEYQSPAKDVAEGKTGPCLSTNKTQLCSEVQ